MKRLCIYHGNCADGFTAAWIVRRAWGAENVDFHAGVYQDAPPDVTGRDVILVDFSYKRAVLMEMAAKANSILILDHHKSAAEDLAGFPPPSFLGDKPRVSAIFDMKRSGAGIVWDYFFPTVPRLILVNHVEDRDLWLFKLPETREIQANVFSYPYDFAVWDKLFETPTTELAIEGRAIERKHFKDIAELVPIMKREMVIGGVSVPVASLPYTLASDAGHMMASAHPSKIGVCYWDTPQGRVFNLRSTDDGPDVSEIAKQYDGGGHAHAAGFRKEIGWEGETLSQPQN